MIAKSSKARLVPSQLLDELDEQWSSLKFLGFGAYYAWIFLSYNSDVLFGGYGEIAGNDAMLTMYLASTTALGTVLILAGLFQKITDRIVDNTPFMLCVAALAGAATVLLSLTTQQGPESAIYMIGSIVTGAGTAFVALRLGKLYSSVGARQVFTYTAASFVFAGFLYFVCIGLPFPAGLALTATLPFLGTLFTVSAAPVRASAEDLIPIRELPSGFFPRLVVVVAAFSTIAGSIRGFSAVSQSLSAVEQQGIIIVFATICVSVVLFVSVGLLTRDFDISTLYYPIIVLACLGFLAVPLLGGVGVVQGEIISTAYNLFIMMVWCLLANVANRTDLSSVRVFGFGRGASAVGTTIGWFIGSAVVQKAADNPSLLTGAALAMVFVLLVGSMLILNERTIGAALKKTRNAEADVRVGDLFPSNGQAVEDDTEHREGAWTKSVSSLAETYKLSDREKDVFFLLGKGRTIDYISNDLNISFNTSKSHIRNIYAKIGVHSKQELLDLIEKNKTQS